MKDNFLETFKHTEAYHRLAENPETILIYLGGSRLARLQFELSDYDICTLVKTYQKDIDWLRVLRWEKDNKHLHVYQDVLTRFLTEINWGNAVGMMHLHYLEPDYILYINPEFRDFYTRFLESKESISILGCYMLVDVFSKYLNQYLHSERVRHKPTKRLYHLCVAHSILTKTPLDHTFVAKVKNCKNGELDMMDESRLATLLKELVEF